MSEMSEYIPDYVIVYYLAIMVIWCCVGFVIGYVVDEDHYYGAWVGIITGVIWPFSIVGFVLIGIGELICRIIHKK